MPRYYFHVRDGHDMPDHDGADLPDIQSVRDQAITTAGEMLRDLQGKLNGEEWRMDVADEAGQVVYTLQFSATERAR